MYTNKVEKNKCNNEYLATKINRYLFVVLKMINHLLFVSQMRINDINLFTSIDLPFL